MAKQLNIDGVSGSVSVVDASNPDAHQNPIDNIEDVFFHTDLSYVEMTETALSKSITLPLVPRAYHYYSDGGC